jgi:MFS family permease
LKPSSLRAFRPASLDAVNFLLAEVGGALGPYLNVFLVTQPQWSQSAVGLVTTLGGMLGLILRTPIGAAIDSTRAKRGIILAALVVIAISAATIAAAPSFWPVLMANSLMAIAGDVLGPAVAAITLGLFRPQELARRLGRNSALITQGLPWRAISQLTVEAARPSRCAIPRIDPPVAIPRDTSSRSASVSAMQECLRAAGTIPPW